jgi:methylenetetrahydrofolate reductase (NADPH)
MSVTYGALGNTLSNSAMIAKTIKDNTGAQPLAHLTCVASTRDKVDSVCNELTNYGVENILTLRGDIPKDTTTPIFSDFKHASDLASYIKEKYDGRFGIAGACYPEKHPEAANLATDIEFMKLKQDSGMEFFDSQLFFDNEVFYHFLLKARKAGITVPIIPGIMPVTSYSQIDRMIQVSGCKVPLKLLNQFDRYKDDKAAIEEIGLIFTSYQILDLMANDVDGIHIYSMNKSDFISKLMDNIGYVASGFFK